jgi:hypothetical protein
VYCINAREKVYELVDQNELRELADALLEDAEALCTLSTYAVNFLYLYSRNLLDDDELFDPQLFIEKVAPLYDLTNYSQVQLYIYLYTHCILGETLFYARPIPARHRETYHAMIQELTDLMTERFEDINLDNKFEYLVCSKLVGVKSPLTRKIEDEAERSVSPDGQFLIDQHNNHPQVAKMSFELSEHRNVLYILSHLERSA